MRLRQLTPVLAAFLLAGCGSQTATTESGGSPDDLRGRTFVSTEVTEDGSTRELVDDTAIRLELTTDELRVSAGCNTLRGDLSLSDDALRVDDLIKTDMGCPGAGRAEQDSWLAEVFGGELTWELNGDDLRLRTDGTVIDMVDRRVAEPDLPLEGTRWRVESLLEGGAAADPNSPVSSSSAATDSEAWLRIEDGEIKAHGGCNGMGGDVEVTSGDGDATLTVGPLMGTQMACEEAVMTVENHMQQVLHGEVTATVEADRLRLVNEDGLGLALRGERDS